MYGNRTGEPFVWLEHVGTVLFPKRVIRNQPARHSLYGPYHRFLQRGLAIVGMGPSMSKCEPPIRVLRVIPSQEEDWLLVWLKIGPLTIRDVKFRKSCGDIEWPSHRSGRPIVVAQEKYGARVRREIAQYLAAHKIKRLVQIEPVAVEPLCLYCHESLKPNDAIRGHYHRQCLTEYDRHLEKYAVGLASRVGQTNADRWLRRKRFELKRSLEYV